MARVPFEPQSNTLIFCRDCLVRDPEEAHCLGRDDYKNYSSPKNAARVKTKLAQAAYWDGYHSQRRREDAEDRRTEREMREIERARRERERQDQRYWNTRPPREGRIARDGRLVIRFTPR